MLKRALASLFIACSLLLAAAPAFAVNDTITVSWTAVSQDTNNNPTTITSYKIYSSFNGGAFVLNSTVAGNQTQQVFTSRAPGVYIYRVTAISVGGESAPSSETSPIVVSDPNTPPKSPTNVTATLS